MMRVPKTDSNFLRFVWFPNNDLNAEARQYRLTVHVFGAKSSPSVASFALHHCLSSHGRDDVVRNFYFDDFLLSVPPESDAFTLTGEVTEILSHDAFELTQFSSNSREVLTSLPIDKLSNKIKISETDVLPEESALRIVWKPESDTLCHRFQLNFEPDSFTKRSVLSALFSVYDPFNIVCPILIRAKSIFQKAYSLKLSWDEPLPENWSKKWSQWLQQVNSLMDLSICILEQ